MPVLLNPPSSAASRLPQEILVVIFRELSLTMYEWAFSYASEYPTFSHNKNIVTEPDPSQSALAYAILTCRTWRSIATDVLYARPFLISFQRIRLFRRTLVRSPALTSLIRQVYVLDQGPLRPPSQHLPLNWKTVQRAKRSARAELLATLAECRSVECLYLTNRDRESDSILPLDPIFVQQSAIGTRLRSLSLYGTALPFLPNEHDFLPDAISLPVLETLCFREVHFKPDYNLPALPKLHTLQIAQSTRLKHVSPLQIDIQRFPSLRSLGLYENYFHCTVLPECLRQLRRLHVFGYTEWSSFLTWNPQSNMTSMRHLVFGLHHTNLDALSAIELPKTLRAVTFLLPSQAMPPESPIANTKIKSEVLEDIGSPLKAMTEGCELKSIEVIRREFSSGETFDCDVALEKARVICEKRGIPFRVEGGEYKSLGDHCRY